MKSEAIAPNVQTLSPYSRDNRDQPLDASSIHCIARDGGNRSRRYGVHGNGAASQKGVSMKRWFTSMLFTALAVSVCAGQDPSPAAHPGQAATQSSAVHSAAAVAQETGVFTVELAKSLDSKKLKEGDEVDAKMAGGIRTSDGTMIPRGAKVVGHVTQAKARSKGDTESALAIAFDKIIRPGGGDIPIKSVVQAVAPNPSSGTDSGGVSYSGLSEATEKGALSSQTARSVPILNEQSRGVLGIKNLQLGPDGVLISSGKEVKLDSGTQILLDVTM